MDRVGARDRPRSVPLPRVQRPELDDPAVQLRRRHRARRGDRSRHDQRARSESEAVHRSRRQADSVSRLERSADFAARTARSTTRAWSKRSAAPSRSTARIGCSWRRAWGTAAAGKDRTRSTWSARSSSGSSTARRPIGSSRRIRPSGAVDRTRPLCPYPQVAVYKGTGSMDEAANFVCKAGDAAPR